MEEDIKKGIEQDQQEEFSADRMALKQCQTELIHYKEKYAYLMSDFENHRRREAQESVNRVRRAESAMLLEILSIVDNFERALKDSQVHDLQQRLVGFELIYKNLLKFLEKHGVTEMANNDIFDPEYHEALAYVPQEGKASGQIVEVLQKGYLIKENVLRPAQVSVAQ